MLLGKRPRLDSRRGYPELSRYLRLFDGALPAPPDSMLVGDASWAWGMLANDRLGDCTCAAVAHMEMVWTAQVDGAPASFADDQVIALYNEVNGGADNGAVEADVLARWQADGVGGRKILAYAEVNPRNTGLVKLGAWLYSGLYIGLALPASAQNQTVWDVPADFTPASWGPWSAGSWGGHAVNVVGYDQSGLSVVTWGQVKRMTWGFWNAYCDECWVAVPADYQRLPQGAHLTNGMDLAALQADLASFNAGP